MVLFKLQNKRETILIEILIVFVCRAIIIPSIHHPQAPHLTRLESDSSDDGLQPVSGSRDKDRELVSAMLDEAFAMVTPTSTM